MRKPGYMSIRTGGDGARFAQVVMAMVVLLCLGAGDALAQPTVELEPLRSWPAHRAFSPYAAHIDVGTDGRFLMMSRPVTSADENIKEQWRCHVVTADAQSAVSYDVRIDYLPTRCVDALAHPEGGFILRGEVWDAALEEVMGLTSRVEADGEVLWTVYDREFAESDDEDNDFVGIYVGATQGLAIDATGNHVMALTRADRPLGDHSRPLIQAHSINTESGELIGSAKTFGPTNNDIVLDMTALDGEFLVVTSDDSGLPTRFYLHEVGRGAVQFEPAVTDWERKSLVVTPIYREPWGAFYLWKKDDGEYGLARVEDLDSQVWSIEFEEISPIEGLPRYLGQPDRMWVSDRWVVIRHNPSGQHPYLRFFDAEDGRELMVIQRDELTNHDEVGMAYDESGGLSLLALDPVRGLMWEYGVEIADALPGDEQRGEAVASDGCSTTSRGAGWIWTVALFLLWIRRANADCQSRGRTLS